MGELRTRKRGTKWEYSFEGAKVEGKRNSISKSGFRIKAEVLWSSIFVTLVAKKILDCCRDSIESAGFWALKQSCSLP